MAPFHHNELWKHWTHQFIHSFIHLHTNTLTVIISWDTYIPLTNIYPDAGINSTWVTLSFFYLEQWKWWLWSFFQWVVRVTVNKWQYKTTSTIYIYTNIQLGWKGKASKHIHCIYIWQCCCGPNSRQLYRSDHCPNGIIQWVSIGTHCQCIALMNYGNS